MRTTLTIDDDVLTASKAIARQRDRTVGEVAPDLRALRRPQAARERNRMPLLQRGTDAPITLEVANALRDDAP